MIVGGFPNHPTRILRGSPGKPVYVVLLNNNAAAPALLYGSQPHSLLTDGKVIAFGGITPQLTVVEDLWVMPAAAGVVDLRVDRQ
jgi:hypothetical protein